MRFEGKIVAITGAAGQLGKQLAHSFAAEGAQLWLIDQHEERLNAAAKEFNPERCHTLALNITSETEVVRSFSLIQDGGGLDVLVNNAGIGVFSPFWERSYEEFMGVLAVNLGGTFLCLREALKMMRDKNAGAIVNIGSVYGVVSSDPRIYTDCARMNSEVYSASKAGVIQMTKYFAVHAAQFGVRVNCVSPGGIFNNQGDDFVRNYSQKTPFGRMATAEEMCGAVKYLSSEESIYVTGQNIVVDGGFSAW